MENGKFELRIVFKGFDSSEALKDYAHKRLSKVTKHLHQMTHCDLVLSIEKTQHVAEAHLVTGDLDAKGEARAENMYAAIDELSDKLMHQTRKHKEKITDHSGMGHHNSDGQAPEEV
jgi:putative sigma-54 modulation protein